MRAFRKCTRILLLFLLCVSVSVPVFLHSLRIKQIHSDSLGEFVEDLSIIKHRTEAQTLSVMEQEEGEGLKEPPPLVYEDFTSNSSISFSSNEDDEARVAADDATLLDNNATSYGTNKGWEKSKQEDESYVSWTKVAKEEAPTDRGRRNQDAHRLLDERIKEMKDQVIRAKAYLNFTPGNSTSHIVKELKLRIKEVERAMSQCIKDSRVSRSSIQKLRAMESTLSKASHIYPDCASMVKRLRAMTYNAEEQVRSHHSQETFLKELGGRTIPKGLHCLSMRLTAEYFALEPKERELPNKHKLRYPDHYHFAIFSDNILACSVVVNSTVATALEPEKIVFHVVTDSLNLPAMTMWFLLNPPGKATVEVQSIENFQWLSTKYNVTLQKEGSLDPRYTSELNHLRFYVPEVFPQLGKIVLLDHDVVVQKDLSKLWSIDMRGRVNGAVQTCKEGEPSFRRMDKLINFTDPMIARKFNAKACTWAFGMNLFDLKLWRRRNLTALYHKYLHLGSKRSLWKAGSLPIGWVTFYKETVALDKRWHVLGLGNDPGVSQEDIDHAAVIHFDGIYKPWLDVGFEKYKHLWRKHVKYDHLYLQQCNIHE